MNCILATSVRNEGPYLLEWYCHHKLIGFNQFIIYSNDNDDGSDELLREMQAHGLIAWRHRKLGPKDSPQLTAYKDLSNELLANTGSRDYLLWLDPDEMLVLKKHNTIQELLAWLDFPDGVSFNWKHFGGSGLSNFTPDPTVKRFLLADSNTPLNYLLKTICRTDSSLYLRINNHRPEVKPGSDPKIIYATPDKDTFVPKSIISGKDPRAADGKQIAYELCQLNHYSIRSKQEFKWKQQRGNGRLPNSQDKIAFLESYWKARDLNKEVDDFAYRKYCHIIKGAISEMPASILNAHQTLINNISIKANFSPRNGDTAALEDEIISEVQYCQGANLGHLRFRLDESLLSITRHRQSGKNIGGVAIGLINSKIICIRLVDSLNRSIEAEIGLPSPAMEKAYSGHHNSAKARFCLRNVPIAMLTDARIEVVLENKSTYSCATIKAIHKPSRDINLNCLPRNSHILDFSNMAEIIKSKVAGREIVYIANRGNYGDALIRHGALSFFRHFGFCYDEHKKEDIFDSSQSDLDALKRKVCIYGGSGAWCNITPGASSIVDKLCNLFGYVIVLPSTYEVQPTYRDNLMLWARGGYQSYVHSSGYFCHDMAFMLGNIACKTGEGDAYCFRTDKESSGLMQIPSCNYDLSRYGNAYSNPFDFFNYLAAFKRVYTDRLHVAIAAALMGKTVHLSRSSYFKTKEIYASSINGFFESVHYYSP